MDEIRQLVDLVQRYSASTILTAVGLLVMLLGLAKLRDREQTRRWRWIVLTVLGLVVIVGGQSLSVWNLFIDRRLTPKQAFNRLQENARVEWLVRLIAYDPEKDPQLHIKHLNHLGYDTDLFVFVADYDELKGYTVREAIYRTGNSLSGGRTRVSAVIFPLTSNLYPANARGVLQVIRMVDQEKKDNQEKKNRPDAYRPFPIPAEHGPDLDREDITSYAWSSSREKYDAYRRLVETFIVEKYSAARYFGSINRDWHPLGYSKIIGLEIPNIPTNTFQLSHEKETISLPQFGARAFLTRNVRLEKLDNVILIDFKTPTTDRIPDLGGKDGKIRIGLGGAYSN